MQGSKRSSGEGFKADRKSKLESNDTPIPCNTEQLRDYPDKTVRKSIRKLGRFFNVDYDEVMLPAGFEFPAKDMIRSLKRKQRELFYDRAADCSERILDLTKKLLESKGNVERFGSISFRDDSMKSFEYTELWRNVSSFTRRCCSKAVRAMHEDDESRRSEQQGSSAECHKYGTEDEDEEEEENEAVVDDIATATSHEQIGSAPSDDNQVLTPSDSTA